MATTMFPSLLRVFFQSPWLRPLNDPAALDDLLSVVDPLWSLSRVRARVVDRKREAPGVTTLVLETNRRWPGHVSGQHVTVEVEVDGRRLRRPFSLSSAPRGDGLVEITVKLREGGAVSRWWNEDAAVGDVLTLGEPSGDFVLPPVLSRRLVMLTAGSGLTPVMAMLRELRGRAARTEVVLVHSARTRGDAIFAEELDDLARSGAWLDYRPRLTATDGRLDDDALDALAREAGDAPAYVCGPVEFALAVHGAWSRAGLAANLRTESFGAPRPRSDAGTSSEVHARRSARTFTAQPGQSLLEAAEAAGLRPSYGCRAGICQECRCRKLDGVVEDIRDGRRLDEPGESIQLCVTVARSAVTLDL
jgi:ferredoxin-NADP reductase